MTPGARVTLTHPLHRGQGARLGTADRGKWWVHLDQPFRDHATGLWFVSARVGRRFINVMEKER